MHGISRKCFCFRKLLLRISNKFSLLFYISRNFRFHTSLPIELYLDIRRICLMEVQKPFRSFPKQTPSQHYCIRNFQFAILSKLRILLEKSEVSMCGNTTAAEKSFVLREPEVNIPKAPHSMLHVEWLGVCSCKRNYLGGDGSAFWEANPLTAHA